MKRTRIIILREHVLLAIFLVNSFENSLFAMDNTQVTVSWVDDSDSHVIASRFVDCSRLSQIFDQVHFYNNLLPCDPIKYRYEPEQSIDGELLLKLVQSAIDSACSKKSDPEIEVLKDRNFNFDLQTGLLILKLKKYPFVIKIFKETPASFSKPFSKGFEPTFFFIMGGGINRHLLGFTRIPNAQKLTHNLKKSLRWSHVEIPRKWYYLPENFPWIVIKDANKSVVACFPGTYAIIADALPILSTMKMSSKKDREESLALCNCAGFSIDPHIDNFCRLQLASDYQESLGIIDTEHFPTMCGFHATHAYTSQMGWYADLSAAALKCLLFK